MPPSRPRLVRREPLISRIKAYLDPWDFLLWVSEELNGNDWEDFYKQWATPIGVLLNIVFMIARSNASGSRSSRVDDVFGDSHGRKGSGWLSWFAHFIVHFLTLLSVLNAIYTFTRKRHYRLFEASVEAAPATPSARRVKVDSSPLSSSPLRFLSNMLAATTAESRAYPDAVREVWELAVWDPTPLCLRLFGLFSPGHVLVYWLFLPLAPLDPRPSVTVATTIILAILLSAQLMLFQTFFSQQSKDSALIYKEVQNEYDTKFVNPSLNRPVRDVGTQILSENMSRSIAEVNTYTPTTFVNRGFRTNPNPNYAAFYDPGSNMGDEDHAQQRARPTATSVWRTPEHSAEYASPLRAKDTTAIRPPQYRTSSTTTTSADGGSFGVYNHAHSPLRKGPAAVGRSGFGGAGERSSMVREGSPLKRSSTPGAALQNGVVGRHSRLSQFGDAGSWK